MAVDRLDGDIDVENPWLAEQRLGDRQQIVLQPGRSRGFVDLEQRGAYRILADHLLHAQKRGVDGVSAQGADVGVALVAAQNRQHRRAQHVAFGRCVGAGPRHRTLLHPGLEQSADL
jgi:hypothetical protein